MFSTRSLFALVALFLLAPLTSAGSWSQTHSLSYCPTPLTFIAPASGNHYSGWVSSTGYEALGTLTAEALGYQGDNGLAYCRKTEVYRFTPGTFEEEGWVRATGFTSASGYVDLPHYYSAGFLSWAKYEASVHADNGSGLLETYSIAHVAVFEFISNPLDWEGVIFPEDPYEIPYLNVEAGLHPDSDSSTLSGEDCQDRFIQSFTSFGYIEFSLPYHIGHPASPLEVNLWANADSEVEFDVCQ